MNVIADAIRGHLYAIKIGHRTLEYLIDAYNWATSPSRLMTDEESKACRTLARYCTKRLEGIYAGQYRESESGILFIPSRRG